LAGGNPLVFRKRHFREETNIGDFALRGHPKIAGQRYDEIRRMPFGMQPALFDLRRQRKIGIVSLWRA
jgi:hypothetical protein